MALVAACRKRGIGTLEIVFVFHATVETNH